MRDLIEITLGGREYQMLATFEAFQAVQSRLEASMPTIAALHEGARLTSGSMARIVLEGLKAAGPVEDARFDPSQFTVEAVEKRLFERGIASDAVMGPVADLLEAWCYTPDQIRKKREAAAQAQAELSAAMSSSAFAPPLSD